MKRRLVINLATRARPHLLLPTVATTLANIVRPDTLFLISVDADDEATIAALPHLPSDPRLLPLVAKREDSLGGKFNRALRYPAAVYLSMVDYAPHVTPGFDDKILAAAALFPDGIGAIYNRLANLSFPEINAVTAELAYAMGYMYPPYFPYWFVDHWLDDVARMIGRIAWADVALDTSRRPGTSEMREPAFWATVYDLLAPLRQDQARAIMASPDFATPQWEKDILVTGFAAIEQRSRLINDEVRRRAHPLAASDGGERYARLRQQALMLTKPILEARRAAAPSADTA